MKRFSSILAFLILSFCAGNIHAQNADTVIVPASVKETFFNIYPLATNVKWSRSTLYANDNVKYIYKVKFRMGFYMISTSTDTSGSRFAEFSHEA
ncbi:MAG TPA: hypothetical protein VNY36_00325, partial [Bacteroidia bacterium]|nr:hypothetical protein [Bacteroidia bacterium]